MRLRFTPRATQDLATIGDYIREKNPAAASRVRTAILKSLQNLAVFAHMGRRQSVEGVRKMVTRRDPYLLYYRVDADAGEIVVPIIQHPARRREYEDA